MRKRSEENGNIPDSGCTDEDKAKVEAEAVHGAQGWKIHDGTS